MIVSRKDQGNQSSFDFRFWSPKTIPPVAIFQELFVVPDQKFTAFTENEWIDDRIPLNSNRSYVVMQAGRLG
jgi:hypothetical protein